MVLQERRQDDDKSAWPFEQTCRLGLHLRDVIVEGLRRRVFVSGVTEMPGYLERSLPRAAA